MSRTLFIDRQYNVTATTPVASDTVYSSNGKTRIIRLKGKDIVLAQQRTRGSFQTTGRIVQVER